MVTKINVLYVVIKYYFIENYKEALENKQNSYLHQKFHIFIRLYYVLK